MSEPPQVAIIDDGELDDVRALLDELGTEFAHWKKSEVPRLDREPSQLLVTTALLAVSLGYRRLPGRHMNRAVWIAVSENDTRSQRNMLVEGGFDYLVYRPVHPSALRMLLHLALHGGDNSRRVLRIPVGYPVSYRGALLARPATLVDLSPGGCRLFSRHAAKLGSHISVQFPAVIAGRPFSHKGEVIRVSPAEPFGGDPAESALAIRFARYRPEIKQQMLKLLNSLSTGPPKLPPGALDSEPRAERPQRGVYEVDVPIFGLEDTVLIGRDLAPGGLRVDPHPALTLGARIRLVVGDADGRDSLVVDAEVIRDDGGDGVAVRFDGLDSRQRERMRAIVSGLPELERPSGEPPEAESVILAKLLPHLVRYTKS